MDRDRCDECGFVYVPEESDGAGPAIAVLRDPAADVARRRATGTWSPLEYGCHLRDVILVQRERVLLARQVERPSLTPMGRDDRVEHDGYSEQLPADVARQLEDAARLFANVLSRLGPADWERTLMYNFPTTSERSLRWVAVHTLHEARHHLADIERQVDSS